MTLCAVVTAGVDDAHLNKIAHKADAILMRMGLDPMRIVMGFPARVPPRIAGPGNIYET